MLSHRTHIAATLAVAFATFGAPAALAGQPAKPVPKAPGKPGQPEKKPEFAATLRAELDGLLAKLSDGAKAAPLVEDAERIFDAAVAYARLPQDAALLRDAAVTRRLVLQAAELPEELAARTVPLLLQNPDLRATFALAVRPEDDVPAAYALLASLAEKRPKDVADGGGLTEFVTAVCLVHDGPPVHPVLRERQPLSGAKAGGTPPWAQDPVGIFEHLAASRKRLSFRGLPVELAVFVADLHVDAADRAWALKTNAGNRSVGKLYETIVYDTAHFRFNKPKKVLENGEGYTLRNIKKSGGVCAEQAYFASEVGKSIGVPAVYTRARGTDVNHAYVGYLKVAGKSAEWDFSDGRFGPYEDVRGEVWEPQTGRFLSDSFVRMTAGLLSASDTERQTAAALTDAAERLGALAKDKKPFPPRLPEAWPTPNTVSRKTDVGARLELLRAAIKTVPAYARAWEAALAMAGGGREGAPCELSGEQRKDWADAALTLCGREHADFAAWFLSPLIASVKDPEEQSRMWDWAYEQFRARPDLASEIRFSQGKAWEKAGKPSKAWEAYRDVIVRYANDSPSVYEAIRLAEKLLIDGGKTAQALDLYQDAMRRISRPEKMSDGFQAQSTYYKVGARYATLLDEAGKGAEASRIRSQIGAPEPREPGPPARPNRGG